MKQHLLAVLTFVLLATPLFAQTPASTSAAKPDGPLPAFEIADVHPSSHVAYPDMNGGQLFGDRYVMHQATMLDLIRTAYGLDGVNVQGGPPWMERYRFDIIAKTAPKTPPAKLKLMLRQLLADRFHLVEHMGSKPMPAWVLTVKEKDKVKESASPGTSNCKNDAGPGAAPNPNLISLTCTSWTMDQFTGLVHNFIGGDNAVIDSTGLTGVYDFHIQFTPPRRLVQAGADGVPIQQALEKQLGLKLELLTAPREVLLVDSVDEKPTPNSPELAKLLPPPPPAEFEVATIKPSNPDAKEGWRGNINGGQVDLQNIPLRDLIVIAWNLNEGDDQVLGNAPKWLGSDKFDILAKVSHESLASDAGTNLAVDFSEIIQMLQRLLIERFQMKVHMEDRPIDAYRLVAASPKLHPATDPNARTVCKEGPGPDGKDPRTTNPVLSRLLTCTNMTMAEICEELQQVANGYIHNSVEDATGLKGRYDFTLSFSGAGQTLPGAGDAKAGEASEPNGAVTLFDAVSKQLGLKLEKEKRALPVLVIDHVEEKPTAN